MRKLTAFLLVVLLLMLVGCKIDQPLDDQQLPGNNNDNQLNIYVCGAVQNEGYISVEIGADYFAVVNKAGILPQSKMPDFGDQLVDKNRLVVVVGYIENGISYDCINVNGPLVTRRTSIKNVDDAVVDILADFIENNGEIHNRKMLKLALGDFYQDNFYKFFVHEDSYEKAD